MTAKKHVRPTRIFADLYESAVIVEYLVETYDHESSQITSERKQTKLRIKTPRYKDDVPYVSQKLTRKCKYIPEQWIDEVEDAVEEIYRRSLDDGRISNSVGNDQKDAPSVCSIVDQSLDLLYGDDADKVEGTAKVLKVTEQIGNLESLACNHQLMSALSRTLSEDSSRSTNLSFNLGRIFLALSNFIEMHQTLSNYRIGSLAISVVNLEVKRAQQRAIDALHEARSKNSAFEGPVTRNCVEIEQKDVIFDRRQDYIIYIFLSVLTNLADDVLVQRKMVKKSLVSLLSRCLDTKSKIRLLSTLVLMEKCSIFEETVLDLSEQRDGIILKLKNLLSSSEEKVVKLTLRLLFNLSFNKKLRTHVIKEKLHLRLFKLLKKSSMRALVLKLLYNLSVEKTCRKDLTSVEFVSIIIQLITNFPQKCLAKELGAVAINATLNPICAGEVLHRRTLRYIFPRVCEHRDLLLTKVLRNLSQWTRQLQGTIVLCQEKNDIQYLCGLTNDPYQFVKKIIAKSEDGGSDHVHSLVSTYEDHHFWNDHLRSLLDLCLDCESHDLLVELIGTLGNMTAKDLPKGKEWNDIISEFSLANFLAKLLLPGMGQIDVKLEAIILCGEICNDERSSHTLYNSKVPSAIHNLWMDCGKDNEMALQILCTYKRFLLFNQTANCVISSDEAIENIFDCSLSKNLEVKHTAEDCLDMIQNIDQEKDDHEELGGCGTFVRERRFHHWHEEWLQQMTHQEEI